MLDSLLEALGYVGDSLAKPGRAVRGLLAGRPDEGLAAIPFSDALGITDPTRAVTGHDLLQNLGIDPGDGLGGTLAGIGVDMATDPLTYAGGALARGLVGGRFARRGAADDIFDLVSPAEREADAARAAMVDRAFPVPSPESPPTQAGGLVGNLAGGDRAPLPMLDQQPPLTGLPSPYDYHAHIGYGPDWFHPDGLTGIPQDVLQDGLPMEAVRASLGGWGRTLDDLDRLTPEARGSLIGTADLTPEAAQARGAAAGVPITETGRQWQGVMQNRMGDLQALIDLQHQLDNFMPPDLYQQILAQQQRMAPLSTWTPQSSASIALKDIANGVAKPSEIPGQMEYISHLPVDEATIRKMAALGQQRDWTHNLDGLVSALTDDGAVDLHDLENAWSPRYLLNAIGNQMNPKTAIEAGLEPGIAMQMIRNPPPEQAATIQQLLDLYNRLRTGSPDFASKFPKIG